MFRPSRPQLRGQATPRGAATLVALAAALISACGTPGAPTPGVTPVPDGKPPAQADGRPRELLLARSLRGSPAAAEIAKAMDAADLKKTIQVLELTRNDTPIWWRNETSGREFLLTPRGSFGGEHGPCREFTVDVTTGKTTDRLQGTACQHADALWKLMP
jgi:surface antigen